MLTGQGGETKSEHREKKREREIAGPQASILLVQHTQENASTQATFLTAKFGLRIEDTQIEIERGKRERGSKGFQTDVPSGRGSGPDRIINH